MAITPKIQKNPSFPLPLNDIPVPSPLDPETTKATFWPEPVPLQSPGAGGTAMPHSCLTLPSVNA
ncbi:hypothetical protein COCMIDRAFT_81800 [Bipolaris oryzae ATCC 44560]|uniref:Uncharacterized protein n=1 Tax=Bipolaris oryzae ATCC 44560 TaxID=930090 RepID=W6ZK81_COCMI|nr:uncharacterized protein COCMIDRAFT_81800 [Bipolaris oryzae ATCC 44560]EUC50485.1 hypothetical protein COCMIDRAFT_81800 [Bipolaris oryzae ATCC 44560]